MRRRRITGGLHGLLAALIAIMAACAPTVALATTLVEEGAVALPPDLARALHDYNEATIRSDTAALARLVTDDYMLVNSDASVQDKSSYLADFRAPAFKLDPYRIEQPVFRMFGAGALTGGVFQLGWTQDGRHQNRRLRVVHFWMKQDRNWRIAYTQLTRVPE